MKILHIYRHWVLLTMILAALPSLVRLPFWVAAIALVGGVLPSFGSRRRRWAGRLVSILLLLLAVAGVWFSFESWFSGDAVLSFFIVVVFLKWSESYLRRDYLLLIFASMILTAIGALHWENLLSLLHMLLVVFVLTVSLVAIHADDRSIPAGFMLRRGGLLFLLGLPLMLLLFVTFPRIPGPLWDVGLAFGLPVKAMMDRGGGNFGKMKVLEPGGIQRAKKINDNVLVAEFKGAVPFRSRLYWRGPVFWDFDGEKWNLPDNFDNRTTLWNQRIKSLAQMKRMVRYKKDKVQYTLRVMPNGSRWLYGLEIPGGPGPESFISDEMQLMSVRVTDEDEAKMELVAYLEYGFGDQLSAEQKEKGLVWPKESNPRLKALGEKLAAENKNTEEIVHAGLALLAQGKFEFNNGYLLPVGKDVYDRFFFDEKKGGAEYLAGSFAMLMRAAGVPARLVGGFRGGTIIALTNFVIVKRADAHVWLEIWRDDRGWTRVEPKDIVLPPGKKEGQTVQQKAAATSIKVRQGAAVPKPAAKPAVAPATAQKKVVSVKEKGWRFPDLGSIFGGLQKWVIDYNPERQVKLFKGAGMENSNWLNLLISGVGGVAVILLGYLGTALWRGRKRRDPLKKAWDKFCRRLAKLGVKKGVGECPEDYLNRIRRERPELEAAAADIVGRYTALCYGIPAGGRRLKEDLVVFTRQVKRFIDAL